VNAQGVNIMALNENMAELVWNNIDVFT